MPAHPVTTPPFTRAGSEGFWTTWQLCHEVASAHPDRAAFLALRTRSGPAREALAMALTRGGQDDAGVRDLALRDTLPGEFLRGDQARQLAWLALVWAGQGRSTQDLAAAAAAYSALWAAGAGAELPPLHHRVAAQTLFLAGRTDRLRELLPQLGKIPPTIREHLLIDLAHPYLDGATGGTAPGHREWERLLSGPFTAAGHAGLTVRPPGRGESHLFDQLGSTGTPASVDGPLVTVIMPCFRPDEGLLTSVASITAQTHGELQVVLVDDASGPQSEPLFAQAVATDDRIELLRMDRNGGSYLGRNAALQRARGEFVTFQDADDWSHPERIAAQVALLTADPAAAASRSLAVRARDDLTHQWLGYPAVRDNASSLMIRSRVIEQIGPFLPVRKGADSEYAERVTSSAGPVADTGTPLAVTRLRSGSLSRGDFTFQWTVPDRLSFRGTYRSWLRSGRAGELPVPLTFLRGLDHGGRISEQVETAYLGDFSADPQEDAGRVAEPWDHPPDTGRVGLWHAESPWAAPRKRAEMHPTWFDRVVHDERWQVVTRVEPVRVGRLVVLDPSVLLLADEQDCLVRADRVEVWLRPEDEEPDRAGLPLDLPTVGAHLRRWFGVPPEWVRET